MSSSPSAASQRVPPGLAAALLTAALIGAALASDAWLPNSALCLPLLLGAAVSLLACRLGVPRLRALKLGQFIREDGPAGHRSKAGTPTMGGVLVVPAGVVVGALVSPSDPRLPAVALVVLAYMLIGGFDDWRSLTRRTNTGLTPRGKLLLQAAAALAFVGWCWSRGWLAGGIALPWALVLPLGLLIWPLALFVFLAESNATNLTDGLDGLAAGCGAVVFTGLALQLVLRGNGGDPAMAGFSAAMAGSWLGFLAVNRHPARVFMGDTGSLAMGAALSAIALLSDSLWPLLLMGGVFLAESLSVIVQVWVFKATKGPDGQGKRVLRMAPLHHHFELGGADEQQVVLGFWLVSAALVGLGLLLIP
ncbi:phospho-N-acetylmuramoyl-pentapeptide-transferase [Synechococcus sp. RSCCF101]|uniref:phospho-N-acetylmuramoyl-pentapeptide- transferase n=1 Tax=Synechococcus sp. RSCCF101 TaxID=2511069 RepID=UPI00124483C8|nr:phospho-N-acetylmuramoyl-pentapeptide-transferase [Synechococcus sp. RSCCF101]QEY32593.1 phospho-N-acetylmuramoyl-pentapeptide-transferase [Synechococcus sp. RSCCF101]